MSSYRDSLVAQLADATTADQFLAVEVAGARAERFDAVDRLTAALLQASFGGRNIVQVARQRQPGTAAVANTLSLALVIPGQVELLAERYVLPDQQARGAWWLPDHVTLKAGLLNVPAEVLADRRFVMGMARDDQVKVALASGPDALFVWAVLEGLFELLLAPLDLRGRQTGKKADEQRAAWAAAEAGLLDLGLDVSEPLAVMGYGSGWSRLRADEQRQAKKAFVAALAGQVDRFTASRWRARRIAELIARFKAKGRHGTPTQQEVLTRSLGQVVAGWFAGDWLAFLDYVEETPSPSEQITTALPEPRLYVRGSEKVREVAANKGLPLEEVERMLASFYGQHSVKSPVEQRVDVLRRYWAAFDDIHARQTSGMSGLWGLVDDGLGFFRMDEQPYQPGLHRTLLPVDLVAAVDGLWGTECLSRWPERIVGAPHPHKNLAETFGAALRFWNGCALTVWFICEGPYSRTDLAGIADYHARELGELSRAGTPIDHSLFAELKAAEHRLGEPTPIITEESIFEVAPGISMTMTMSGGSRRDGFEILRDIVTRHRRVWAADHLERFLTWRWDSELREVAWEHSRWLAAKAKAPTFKQFAKFAVKPANHWFAGDLSELFAAVGETPPAKPERIALMPVNRVAFAMLVFDALGGQPMPREDSWQNREGYEQQWVIRRLANEAPRFVQLQEAMGRHPEPKELGVDRWNWPEGIEQGWPSYVRVVEEARARAAKLPASYQAPAPRVMTQSRIRRPSSSAASPSAAAPDAAQPTQERRGLLSRFRRR